MSNFFRQLWEAIKGEERDYTTGSINYAIFMLAVPMILEMTMESLFAIVDVFFVSQVGVNAVAIVGLTESVMTLVYSLAWGISMGVTAVVARRIGEKHPEEASKAAGQAIWIAVILAVLIGVPGYLASESILRLMGASEPVISAGLWYTKYMFGGNVVIMLLFILNAVFRGAGDASIAMRTLLLSNAINIILDPCLIFGWGPFPAMGVAGAALATNIGRGIGVLYQLYHLFFVKRIIHIQSRHLRLIPQIIEKILRVSTGGVFQFIISSASWIFLMRIMARFGEGALAGYTISIRILIFTILPAWGLANAAATLVGQNLGAEKYDRAEQSVWRTALYTMLFMAVVAVFYFMFSSTIMSWFTEDVHAIAYGTESLRIFSIGYLFFAYGMVLSQAYNGAGDTFTPTLLNLICFWAIQIPLAYFLAVTLSWNAQGVYWGAVLSESLLAVLLIILFKRGRWKKVKV